MYDAGKGVVDEGDVAGVLGHTGARAERQSHVGMVEGWCIVGAVAGHRHHLALLLQQVHQALLVGGTGAAHHTQCASPLGGLLIREGGKVWSGDGPVLAICRLVVTPDSNLSGNLHSRGLGVSRHNLHLYTRLGTVGHSLRHLLTQRVANTEECLQMIVSAYGYRFLCGIIYPSVGEGDGAHGLSLVPGKYGVEFLLALLTLSLLLSDGAAERHDDFGSSLDKFIDAIVQCDTRHHILTLGGKGYLLQRVCLLSDGAVVDTFRAQPEQQGSLGGITDYLVAIEFSGGIEGDGLSQLLLGAGRRLRDGARQGPHLHLVLGERTRLVGTDHGHGSHRLTGM